MTLDGYLSRNYDDLLQAAYRIAGKDGPDLLHEVILQLSFQLYKILGGKRI